MARELRVIEDYLEANVPLSIRHTKDGKWKAFYSVAKCKNSECSELSKTIHGSIKGDQTLCRQLLNEDWWILQNDFSGVITCKKCIAKLEFYRNLYPEYEFWEDTE